jgi:NADH-quinone oxidoreductase subunit J
VTKSLGSTSGIEILFILIGLATFGAAILTVTVRNLVHAALWLVVCLGGLAACYLLLSAELVAWVQVLIYVGAVAVLLLFGLMLTKAPIGRTTELDSSNRWAALLVGICTAGVLITVEVEAFRTTWFDPRATVSTGDAKAIGGALFSYWVLPFELLSVLLLAALVGAIVLSRKDVSDGFDAVLDEAADAEVENV